MTEYPEKMPAVAAKMAEILLVEDNEGDARLALEAMRDSRLANTVHRVRDGEEAMDFLLRRGAFPDAPRPGLILLDLNLPRMNGIEVLAEIKKDPSLLRIPVVILTASSAEEDIVKSYDLHANCFVTKPLGLEQFAKVTRSIEDFWFGIVQLPESSS